MNLTEEQERDLAKTFLEAIVIFYEKEECKVVRLTTIRMKQLREFCLNYPIYLEKLEELKEPLFSNYKATTTSIRPASYVGSSVEHNVMLRTMYVSYICQIQNSAKDFGEPVDHILELMKEGINEDKLKDFYTILDKRCTYTPRE